ncbi:hypothetical protein TNCV_1176811 [Trichonephila clavipes]|nr:hypothetical protein TNCV_1176811 [Trichonephila clavipes]
MEEIINGEGRSLGLPTLRRVSRRIRILSECWAVGSLVSRESDSRPDGLGSRCHQIPSEYKRSTFLLNQWVRKSCGRSQQKSRVQGDGEYFPPVPGLNCGGGDRWYRHLSCKSNLSQALATFIPSLREGQDNNKRVLIKAVP